MKKLASFMLPLIALVVIFIMLGPFYVLDEGEQAVVTRFGAVVRATSDAGLKMKIPVIDAVVKYPKRIQSWDGEPQRIPTRENQFIWVDTTARWKIIDPLQFYEAVTTVNNAYSRLDDVIDSAVRTVISDNNLREAVRNSNLINEIQRPVGVQGDELIQDDTVPDEGIKDLQELTSVQTRYDEVTRGRNELSNEMMSRAAEIAPQYGIELIDIVIRQIRYSEDLTESVYRRMIQERRQIAQAYRSFGEGRKAEWLGRLDNERRRILSTAYAQAEEIRGSADAEAATLYAQAYEQDEEFADFWLSIESYRRTFPQFQKVITTESDYFKYLYSQRGE